MECSNLFLECTVSLMIAIFIRGFSEVNDPFHAIYQMVCVDQKERERE